MKVNIKSPSKQQFTVLLERLKLITSIKPDGTISYHGFEIHNLEWLILSKLDFGETISVHSKKKILNESIKQMVTASDFSETYFIECINYQLLLHQRCSLKKFYLLTNLSIENLPFRKLSVGNSIIRIHGKQFPYKFQKSRTNIIESIPDKEDSTGYCAVSIEVLAKKYMDAYEQAFYQFEIFRSILCLILNSSFEIRFGDRNIKPINKIRQGEFSTLHQENGDSVSSNLYWYVPNYLKAEPLSLDSEKKTAVNIVAHRLINQFNKCKIHHQEAIGKALLNYGSAFDERNKYTAFIKSWTTLEILTNTNQNDVLIKRCIGFYNRKNREYQRQILESLRLFRNEIVHEGGNDLDALVACFHVQLIIYHLIIRFNLQYSGFFKSIDDTVSFMDYLSLDLKEIELREDILKRVIKFKKVILK